MIRFVLSLAVLLSCTAEGAQFFSGQAARAVLGQSSFSSRETGVSGSALSISKNKLFVADSSGKLLTYDLSGLPAPDADLAAASRATCNVCGYAPVSSVAQSVIPGTATVSTWGKSLAVIDSRRHRILFWRDVTSRSAFVKPDVTLQTQASGLADPISIALDGQRLFVGDAMLHAVAVWNTLPEQDNQSPDVTLGKAQADSGIASDTIGRPEALVSDGVNLFVSDTQTHRILVYSPADFHLRPEGLVNSATLVPGALAGGTLIGITGNGLSDTVAEATDDGSQPLPLKLGGVEVIFDGVPVPLVSVSPSEVRAQLPYVPADLSAANLYVRTEHGTAPVSLTNCVPVALAPASPGLFGLAGEEPRPGIAFNDAGPVSQEQPAAAGQAIKLWATGLHVRGDSKPIAGQPYAAASVDVSAVTASVNGQSAEVQQVTLPKTSIGVYELLLRLPDMPYPSGVALVTLSEDGADSNTVSVSVTR